MIDQRAQEFLDSRRPLEREALLAPYRDFVEEITCLDGVFDVESHQRAVARIEKNCIARWAADFMAGYYRDPAGKLRLRPWQLEAVRAVAHRRALQYGETVFDEAVQTILNTPEPPVAEPPKQETWRDRPPLL